MKINFKSVTLHNFGSYLDTTIQLQDKGFCMVTGRNDFKKDNALSNGSGKSMLWSAICYALTGETIGGQSSNLKNVFTEETDCYTSVEFSVDNDHYVITRHHKPKADLKIIKNDADISGKGIRESEKVLAENLPDLSRELIASVILIGQGMPNKFSSFSPSGRKDLLEKLTKSDFMIADIKQRLSARQQKLNDDLRECEDNILVYNTQLSSLNSKLAELEREHQQTSRPDYDTEIAIIQENLVKYQTTINELGVKIEFQELEVENLNKQLVEVTSEKSKMEALELANYNEAIAKLNNDKTALSVDKRYKSDELRKLSQITDICPTCHQKLPNVSKPDTTALEQELLTIDEKLSTINNSLSEMFNKHQGYVKQINEEFSQGIAKANTSMYEAKNLLNSTKQTLNQNTVYYSSESDKLNKLIYDKEHWDSYWQTLEQNISDTKSNIEELNSKINILLDNQNILKEHIAITKKMDTLIKRDFRGYLLTNIINFINEKAKNYCEVVYGTRDLEFFLDGNNINITYCGKALDNLSGGEKTRVDLILQLALRSMLQTYLTFSCNVIVLDEVTDFLDRQSCSCIMKLLEKELNTIESVFIISHHTDELELPIDSEINVIKNTSGISEVF